MIKNLIVILFLFLGASLLGQDINSDSLMLIWNNVELEDSIRLRAFHRIVRHETLNGSLDVALDLIKKQYDRAKQLNHPYWLGKSLNNKGNALYRKKEYEKALDSYFESLEINKQFGKKREIATVHGNIGRIYENMNRLEDAIQHHQKKKELLTELDKLDSDFFVLYKLGNLHRQAGRLPDAINNYMSGLELAEKNNDKRSVGYGFVKIGNLFLNVEDFERAEIWHSKHLALSKELKDTIWLSYAYNNLGIASYEQERYNESLDYYYKSLEIKLARNDMEGIGNTYDNIGRTLLKQEKFEEAKSYMLKSLKVREEIEHYRDMIQSLNSLGEYYNAIADYEKAAEWCEKGYKVATEERELDRLVISCQCLTEAYQGMENYKKAIAFQKEYFKLNDSLYNAENLLKLASIESSFQFNEEKEALEKEQATTTKNYEEKLESSNRKQYILLTIVGLLGLLLYQVYRNYLIKKKANFDLGEKNRQILEDKKTIEEQARKLEEVDELKTRFFMHISHELKTPLTLILGPIQQMIQDRKLSERDYTYARLIENNAQNLLERTNEILTLAKYEKGMMTLEEKPIVLQPLLQSIMNNFAVIAERQNIRFELDYKLPKELGIVIDPKKLEHILTNYISNAFKYTATRGFVQVVVQEIGEKIHIEVKDNGIGIHAKDIAHVFDTFYQSQHTPVNGGTGIGLTLCKELAALMKGRVWVESELGIGSSFYFQFPLVRADEAVLSSSEPPFAARKTEATIPIPKSSLSKRKLLLVEDNLELQAFIQMILTDYEVIAVGNGVEALEYLDKESPELIISDLMMPRMDGFSLLEQLKSSRKWQHIPVIILSARADWEGKIKALRMGVDDYVLKPFQKEELEIRIKNLLRNKQERQLAKNDSEASEVAKGRKFSEGTQKWLETVEELIYEHRKDNKFNTSAMASALQYSERQLRRRLKEFTGLSPNKYIRTVKLQYARTMLEKREVLTVAEASYAIGFETPQYFSTLFEAEFGKKPIDYIR